jgi:NAD(P)-dependent dehydrogenase (short-subunit alcohol dehydrogenase family)
MAQACARSMIRHGEGGRIINIASVAAHAVLRHQIAYCMSKAAVAHMTRALAAEWGRKGINVNAICPGYIETEINEKFWSTEAGQRMISKLPRQRVGSVEDLDGIVLLLASEQSAFINGSVIDVDDGLSAFSL